VGHTIDEAIDGQILGANAIERRKSAAENVIQTPELTGALDRADIRRFFDCADECGVTPLIAADRTQLVFGQVEASRAGTHAFREPEEGVREPLGMLRGLAEKVVRQPKRGLPANPGQTRKLGGEIVDGRQIGTAVAI
jgi:hypothetical protein